MVSLKNLTFAYRRQSKLFDSLDLELASGQIYGLLGRNGAGKTSLLRILSGLLFPQSGDVAVMGFQPAERRQAFLADVFFLAEDHYLPKMRIRRYVRSYAPFYPNFDATYFERVLEGFGLQPDQRLNDLSYGEAKKALIAFALATRCRLLLMDEPTNGLDIPAKKQFRQLIATALEPDQTILISSHQVRDLHRLIDPVIILDQGKVVLQESLEAIAARLAFQQQFREPAPGEALYYEHGPHGYVCLKPATPDMDSLEVDLEVLFNAVVSRPEVFGRLFQKTRNYTGSTH